MATQKEGMGWKAVGGGNVCVMARPGHLGVFASKEVGKQVGECATHRHVMLSECTIITLPELKTIFAASGSTWMLNS